ncbi:Ktr system potassium uptake protein B [bioreactor metagenome]|uniref:Ktr system potassium uptake protein B n=1 Tax=bioreactor metagenome TaxID=1076179 RepID=A0A645J2H3_9ZZZZ
MFIGAGPGSTGGGIKVTTFVVFALSVLSHARKQKDLNIYHRRLEDSVIKRACGNTGFYLFICAVGIFVLTFQNIDLKDAIFEAFSAVGTVGLTKGITPALPTLSKLAIILLMYSGRVGTLSVAMAVSIEHRDKSVIKNPVEKIIIG